MQACNHGSWYRRALFFMGNPRLSAVEGLDLALFVDAEDQRLVGWIDGSSPNHVLHLGRESSLSRETLNVLTRCGLEPRAHAICVDTAVGEPRSPRPLRLAQGSSGSHFGGFRMQRHVATTCLIFSGAPTA